MNYMQSFVPTKKLTLALFLNDKPTKETVLLVTNSAHSSGGRGANQDVAQLLSFVLSNPMLEQVFSIMNCYWRN
jgi:NAD(P)H-dependent FMN reductase